MSAGIQIPDSLLARRIPKLGMTKDEVFFSFGSHKLARDLIALGKLVGKKAGSTTLFDANHVELIWKQWRDGDFDHLLN